MPASASRLALAAALFAASLTLVLFPARAQNAAEPAPAPKTPRTIFALEHAAASDLLPDPRDAALRAAWQMLPARLREVKHAAELQRGGQPRQVIPDEFIDLLTAGIDRPVRFAVVYLGTDPKTRLPSVGVKASYRATGGDPEADARRLHAAVEKVRMAAPRAADPKPNAADPNLLDIEAGSGVVTYGPVKKSDGWRYEVTFGALPPDDALFAALPPGPDGATPVLRAAFDLSALSPISETLGGLVLMAVPNSGRIMTELRDRGIVGDEAVAFEFSLGYRGDEGLARFAVKRAAKFAEAAGLATVPISEPLDIAAVPADATFAYVGRADIPGEWKRFRTQIRNTSPEGLKSLVDALRRIREQVGVDLEKDVIDSLGTTAVIYIADRTGGNSLLSAVAMVAVADYERLANAIGSAAKWANAEAAKVRIGDNGARFGAVRLHTLDSDGVRFVQLRFPGLPIPAEPTLALIPARGTGAGGGESRSWLLVGATPQAAASAVRFIAGTEPGDLLSSPAYRTGIVGPQTPKRLISLTCIDTPRTITDGFPLLSMLGSSLANGVRSPVEAAGNGRDPGVIVPPLNDLRKDAKRWVALRHWDGEDLVTSIRADRSALVNIAGVLGVGDAGPLVTGMVIGSGLGAAGAEQVQQQRAGRPERRRTGGGPAPGSPDETEPAPTGPTGPSGPPERRKVPY
ncbi:MAG: hypothetical protein IBJ11_01315 [Phycisphaerales bacterium]|nr:hypothetical protein [Phycisphaerales bacterium]